MILVDDRVGSKELLPLIQKIGVSVELSRLEFGDFCFEGNGPNGKIMVGIERKTLHDMLHCIDDARYAGFQRPGMVQHYHQNILMLEGLWRPHDPAGSLMEGFSGGMNWGTCRYHSRVTEYHKLFRYLLSIQLSGVIITQSRDLFHTAYNITECFHYFQKPWHKHTSLIEIPKMPIAQLSGKISLVRKWAEDLEGVGVTIGPKVEGNFSSGQAMANAQELDWMRIKGVSAKLASKIVHQIRGWGGRR